MKRREVFQEFEMHPAFPPIEGKHSEPWHDIFECSLTHLSHYLSFGERKKTFKSFGEHPTSPHHEGKHSEPRNNIFGVLVDTFITPPYIGELVISCDMIICMNAN